jgi:hypothetical protein
MRRLVTEQDAVELHAMAAMGLTATEIAALTGWSKITIYKRVKFGYRKTSDRWHAEMIDLAKQGLSRTEIALETGRSLQTVGRHVGHLVPVRRYQHQPDIARYRRMISAVENASYGERDSIAKRFGLKNAKVLKDTLPKARRYVADASRSTPSSADRGRA